jgi:hypothetical protein
VSAVIAVRQAIGTDVLVGEARALATSTGAHRRIRSTRRLSWIAYGVWTAAGAGLTIAAAVTRPFG